MYTATIHTEKELGTVAQQLLQAFPMQRVFLFSAEMGAGKTTIIKELCRTLGVKDGMSSPTYSIVNEYSGENNTIYHFDLYRLKNIEESMDIGFEEYVNSGNYCFIEWPEIAKPLLPETFVEVKIHVENEIRYLQVNQLKNEF